MPLSDLHRKKLKKNLAIAALIFIWCALIWMVTMVRLAHADEGVNNHIYEVNGFTYRGRNYSGIGIDRKPVDAKGGMYETRFRQRQHSSETKLGWDEDFFNNADLRQQKLEDREATRFNQLTEVTATKDRWDKTWFDTDEDRLQKLHVRDQRRLERVNTVTERHHSWGEEWSARQQEKDWLR